MSLSWYLILAGVLFTVDAVTVLVRHFAIISLMGVKLILNSVNLAFVTPARILGGMNGEIVTLFVMIVATIEIVAGLAIIMSIFKSRSAASVDDVNLLKN